MKCPNCNNELFEGTKVCPFCSTSVEATRDDAVTPPEQTEDAAPLNQTENNFETAPYQNNQNAADYTDTNNYQQPPNNNQGQYYQPPVNNGAQGQYYNQPVQPQSAPQGNYYQPGGFNQPPINPADPYAQQFQQPDPIAEADANSAKTLGIVSIIFAFLIPLVSWICGGIGLSKAKKVLNINPMHPKAKNAKTLCTVGIILGIVIWIFAMIINVSLGSYMFDSFM